MSYGDYYDKHGNKIDELKYNELIRDKDYKFIDCTIIKDYKISTVWLGFDHGHGGPKVLVCETMVFPIDSYDELDCKRYGTAEEALAGHTAMVYKWAAKASNES